MVQQMDVRELARRLANDHSICLVDVRQPWENQLAALPGSLLIPLKELPQRWREIPAPGETAVVVYCHHGVRSLTAADFLERVGLGEVFSLQGGIDAWSTGVDPSVPRY